MVAGLLYKHFFVHWLMAYFRHIIYSLLDQLIYMYIYIYIYISRHILTLHMFS